MSHSPDPSPPTGDAPKAGGVPSFLLDALLRDTSLCLAVMDASGTMTMMSPGLQSLMEVDYVPLQVDGILEQFDVRVEDGSRRLRPDEEPLNRTRLGETIRDEVYCVPLSGDRVLHLRGSGTPLRDAAGQVLGGILLFDDITAERAVLRVQAQLRDRLVTTVNHELRTPLTVLLGHAELLAEIEDTLPAEAVRSLRAVVASGERLRDLAQTVTDLVDLENSQHVDLTAVDVTALARRVVAALNVSAREESVTLRVMGPERFVAQMDGALFGKALGGLVDNSIRHAPPDSTVFISLRSSGQTFSVEVVDSGPGIPDAERGRLVQPFERGDVQRIAPNGRGLGLALARTFAVAHHGRLCLEDNVPSGLRVRVELPFVPPPFVSQRDVTPAG